MGSRPRPRRSRHLRQILERQVVALAERVEGGARRRGPVGDQVAHRGQRVQPVGEADDMFLEMWPKAMAKLKEVAESNN